MWTSGYLLHFALCALPLSAALSPQVLERRDDADTYSYTKMGTAHVHDVKTYHTTSTKPCSVTKTAYKTTTKYTDAKSAFTTTVTTTTTKKAKTAYTSTIPASKGFIPIDESIPGASYDPAASKYKRDAVATSPAEPILARDSDRGRGGFMGSDKYSYPESVQVVHWKWNPNCDPKTITHTKTETKCKGHAPKTVTTTVTSTTTKYPSTASPVYGACQTNNIATSYKGLPLFELRAETSPDPGDGDIPGYTYYALPGDISTGYQCCVAAILSSPPIAFWGLAQNVGNTNPADNTTCIVIAKDGCTAPQRNPTEDGLTFEIRSSQKGYTDGRIYTAGNAYCGQWFRGCTVVDDGTEDGIQSCNPPKAGT